MAFTPTFEFHAQKKKTLGEVIVTTNECLYLPNVDLDSLEKNVSANAEKGVDFNPSFLDM